MLTLEEKLEHYKKYQKEYKKNPKVKEHLKEYFKKYYLENKEKLKEYQKKYVQSPKGKETKKKSRKKYSKSPKGKKSQKKWRKSPKGKSIDYANNIKQKYNLEIDDYNRMFNEQNGCCIICGVHQSKLTKRLSIDHNHKTGKIRGLLCHKCNIGLGVFEDSIEILQKAIEYLKKEATNGRRF